MSVAVVERVSVPAEGVVVVALLVAEDSVAAGFPSPAQDYFDGSLDLNEHLIELGRTGHIAQLLELTLVQIGAEGSTRCEPR